MGAFGGQVRVEIGIGAELGVEVKCGHADVPSVTSAARSRVRGRMAGRPARDVRSGAAHLGRQAGCNPTLPNPPHPANYRRHHPTETACCPVEGHRVGALLPGGGALLAADPLGFHGFAVSGPARTPRFPGSRVDHGEARLGGGKTGGVPASGLRSRVSGRWLASVAVRGRGPLAPVPGGVGVVGGVSSAGGRGCAVGCAAGRASWAAGSQVDRPPRYGPSQSPRWMSRW